MPFSRFLNYVYAWCLTVIQEPEKIEEWKRDLEEPLYPTGEPTQAEMEAEGELFMSNLARFGG